jgi:hypothetical protein
MVLLVTIDHFEPNLVLVNANKLKPYHPYASNTKILVFDIKRGGGGGGTKKKKKC